MTVGVTFQRERAHGVIPDLEPLLMRHWEEIAHFKDIPLNPDFDAYRAMEEKGLLRVFTARNDGVLIGYAIFIVATNIHYATKQAVQDVLFLAPEYRNARVGLGLIQYGDEELTREGVSAVYHHVKAAHDFGPLLRRLGYELVDFIYGKRVQV